MTRTSWSRLFHSYFHSPSSVIRRQSLPGTSYSNSSLPNPMGLASAS